MTAPSMPMPTPIVPPANFPVSWDDPTDGMLLWEQEQLHFPRPLSPLGGIIAERVSRGITAALEVLGAPVAEFRARRINTYLYQALVPDLARLEGAEERVKAAVAQHGFGMYARWQNEYLPEIESLSSRLIASDYGVLSNAEVGAELGWLEEALGRAWEIHFSLVPGFYTAPAFKDSCERLLGLTGLEAYEMSQGDGGENLSVVSGSKLWQLAQRAPASVREVIDTMPSVSALPKLAETPGGTTFLAELDEYLRQYGWRTGAIDFLEPSWIERPDLALDNIRLMFRVTRDPADDARAGAERGEELANQCRAKLADNPAALGEFEFLLGRAREYPLLQENHHFYLDQKLMAASRRLLTEVGRRMVAAGVADDASDFAYLEPGELRAFLGGDQSPRQSVIAERRAEMERWGKIVPPHALGAMPPVEMEDPFFSAFFGKAAVEPTHDPKVLLGTASSRGTATGPARVIRSLSEVDRVQDGDILVCEMTTPSWTPIFASVAGIVSDSGGPLSHCAVVAREYGVPCVTGTRIATQTIPDGVRITVDGTEGVVRIEG